MEKRKKDSESWLKSVSAFANGAGGVLVFGVAPDGTVAGLKDIGTASGAIRKKIRECIIPFPDISLRQKESDDGRTALLLEVLSGQETPYYCISGDMMQAYVRAGKESVPAGIEEFKELILRKNHTSFDRQITEYVQEEFSFFSFCDSYEEWTGDKVGDMDYEEFGMAENGRLTNAGALFADQSPISVSGLVCYRWKGKYKEYGSAELFGKEKHTGGLITLVNEGMNFIKRNEMVLWHEEEGRRIEKPDYCDRSIFEGMVNALAHRDYRIRGSEVRIDMFEDCLTISSPGGMADGTRIQERDCGLSVPVRRNPLLAELFTRIGYMEQNGTGLQKIRQTYRKALNYSPEKEPEIYSDEGQFTVRLKNLNYVYPEADDCMKDKRTEDKRAEGKSTGDKAADAVISLTENEKKILALITEKPEISTNDISKNSGISKRTVERILQSLRKKEILSRGGSRRRGYWIVSNRRSG